MIQALIQTLLLSLTIGILTKYADFEQSKKITKKTLPKIISGILYGFLIAFLIKQEPLIAPLFIATVIGVTISGKIDAIGHFFGISSFIFFLALFGLVKVNMPLLFLFLAIAFADEMFNTYIIDTGKIKNKTLTAMLKTRPFLETAAFLVSFATGTWVIWLSIISFDTGYNLTALFSPNIKI
jgi:hypothetical protein